MTARQIWEGLLIELSKVNAPSLLLEEYNYYINKAIYLTINRNYGQYDLTLQTTDDLRVLKSTATLSPLKKDYNELGRILEATYEIELPLDYLHLLNCICVYKLDGNYKCYNKNDVIAFPAKRLTADSWSVIITDYYNRPLPQRPYYYIHNVNTSQTLPTNPYDKDDNKYGTDINAKYSYNIDEKGEYSGNSNLPRTIYINEKKSFDAVEKETAVRYGNPAPIRCEIRYGNDDSVFKLQQVLIDYIKTPLTIRLTQELIDLTKDTSQIMEFPDYVCDKIVNELVMLVMERTADPRLLTHLAITLSVVSPVQQQAAQLG